MINNPLDDIITLNIDISNPEADIDWSDKILVIVPAPTTGTTTLTKATSISKAKELLEYGFAEDDVAYLAVKNAFEQSPCCSNLYVYVRQSKDSSTESIKTALETAATQCQFYGIHITSYASVTADCKAAADYAEENEKLFGFEYSDYSSFPLKSTDYYRTFAVYSGEPDESDGETSDNGYAALALMSTCFSYDSGSETWAYKKLEGITPSYISQTEKKGLDEKNVTSFLRYAGTNVTIGGKVLSGEWIDVIRFRDWLKSSMQRAIFNTLRKMPKVPFNDNGIALIYAAMNSVLAEGQTVGGITTDEYDDDGNVVRAYEITVPKASDLTEAQRKSRNLTGCTWTAKLAGAIHLVSIKGSLTF